MSEDIEYDCLSCPYPRYKDGHVIFCDVCIRRILEEQNKRKKKESEAQRDGT